MADNLIFPIGFDLEKAVTEAGKEWDSKYADKFEKLLAKRSVTVKLGFDTKKLDNLDDVKRRLAELKIEPLTPENKAAIKDLVRELKELAKAMEKVQRYSKIQTPELQQALANKANAEAAHMAEKYRQANERLEVSKRRVALAEQKHAEALSNTSKKINEQHSYVSRLIKRMAVYASFSYAGNFLTSVREVTAEYELQRVSLGAIIQDQQRANQLFAEIKSFALTSPLKILDLTKYTKQVAAYGFEAGKLFDTTKMLADISVGLGVDMSRLTLFLGQVYATGYLRASEVRQATEAGIPLVDKLAKKLSEANGRLVTAADVMDLISKRAISFEQVEDVFKDMTSAGGEFYNMQVKQSQTLFGMWSKLGDAAAIMYDEIGNTSSVNEGMKMAIHSIELLMRNWKTAARVLDSVAIAVGVYALGLKNVAATSKAATFAEAARLAITKQQVIATPKLVAAMVGQNAATKLSLNLTKAHTVAMLRQSTATNALSAGFWKLTAAMLANPWIAATAALAGITMAIIHFSGNAETAAERAEKLNNSVASIKNLDDTVTPLVETYSELISKTERTAEEQEKLSEVTHELAKQYPGAITAIGDFGAEVELAADKLNQLYQAEKQARMDNTRHELQETEKQIASTEAKIAQLQNYLSEGKMWGGGQGGAMVPISDEERGRVLKQIDILRYGEDGQGGLNALQQSAEAARRALGLVPSEAAQAVEKFGAWKKTLTTFKQQVGDIRVQLFDDSTINQFGSLEEALKKAAETYKENIALVATYDSVLKSSTITSEERAKIEAERAEADAMATLADKALKYYNTLATAFDKSKGRGSKNDPRLGILQEMVSTLKQVNKEYDDLANKEGSTKALADTKKIYADTFKSMQALSEKYKFRLPEFEVPTNVASLTKYLNTIREAMRKLPKSDKVVLALQLEIDKLSIDEQRKKAEAELKRLAEEIAQKKVAKEFYNKVLRMTGDVELAANVSLQIYGSTGKELSEQIKEQFRLAFATLDKPDVEVSAKIGDLIDKSRYEELRDFVALLPEAQRKAAEDLVKAQQQMSVKQYEQWLKDLEKAKDYADKRIELSRYTANQIGAIEERIAKLNPQAADYEQQKAMLENLIAGYKSREDKMGSELEYEQFKNSALYVQVFENLDNASKTALENMRNRLLALKDQWKNLSPEQVKELAKRLEELDAQIAQRNPFKSIADSIKKLREMRMSGRTKEGDAQIAFDAEADRQAAEAKMLADEKAYEAAVKQYGAESDIAKTKRKIADDSAEAYRRAEQAADSAAENADEWEKVAEAINAANQKLDKYQEQINEALDGIRKIMESFGASAEDMQFFDDVTNGFNEIFDAGQQGAAAYADFMQGNFVGAATKGISAVGSLISGVTNLFYAGRVKRANKEIKRQQELLEQLEYTYGRLEKAADKVFGRDYLNNYNQQLKNLQAQQQAYLKQAEAERSKGKKKDKDKIKEYEEQARETADKIKELQDDLVAHFTGSSKTDVARQMAKSWIDARASMSDTFAAIKGDYQDLIKNMIVEGAAARVIENALTPVWDSMQKMLDKNDVQGAIDSLVNGMDSALNAANNGMEVLWKALEARGYDMKKLIGDTDSEYTGIAKNIAGATSEEINTAATIGNTLLYYAAPIPRIDENLARVVAIMEGRGVALPTASGITTGAIDYTEMFTTANQHLSSLPRMEQHLAEIHTMLGRALKTKGSTTGFNTFLNS